MYYDTVGHASGTEGHFLSENNVPKRIVLLTLPSLLNCTLSIRYVLKVTELISPFSSNMLLPVSRFSLLAIAADSFTICKQTFGLH